MGDNSILGHRWQKRVLSPRLPMLPKATHINLGKQRDHNNPLSPKSNHLSECRVI